MSEEKEKHASGLLYFMPYWIFEHADLSSNEKLIYSLLSGLAFANEHKECFPSDNYIAERLNFSPRSIQLMLKKLEEAGAISRRAERHPSNPFKSIRYIRVHLEPQKMFADTLASVSRESLPNVSQDSLLSVTEYNKELSREKNISPNGDIQEKPSANASSPPIFQKDSVKMEMKDYKKLIEEFGEKKIHEIIERMNEYAQIKPKKFKEYAKHALVIRKWIRSDNEKNFVIDKKKPVSAKYENEKPKTQGHTPAWIQEAIAKTKKEKEEASKDS